MITICFLLAKLYINGELHDTATYTNGWGSGYETRIGKHNPDAPLYFNGSVDEVRVSNVARTAQNISEYYNSFEHGLADSPWPMFRHDLKHTGQSQNICSNKGELLW